MSSPLSGFTAVPNPQMLAFMPIQSYLMMYFAGAGWQIGKRKISAIPNDEFNKMSANDLLKGFTADLRETIPTLERSLNDITPLIQTLIAQYGDFVTVALKEIPQAAQGVLESQLTKEGTLSKLIIEVVGGGTVTGGGAGSKALLFAQKQLQDEVDRLKIETDELKKEKLFNKPFKLDTSPFIGPEIKAHTGEQSDFLKAIQKLPSPAPHIKPRKSNVSLQSLNLERQRLWARVAEASRQLQVARQALAQGRGSPALVNGKINAVNKIKQELANFLKMHGHRFK